MSQRIGTKLFVSRLSFHTTKQRFESLFSPFGELTEASLIIDPKTQRPKGFGFVSYQSEIQAQKAIKALNATIVDGRIIFVEPAKPKDS
ncbi:small RNA-binding protein 11, chloroplastic [Trifolium repens]|nr:small RNA-binding protein 11, chloroplastic [Trifolium repens]